MLLQEHTEKLSEKMKTAVLVSMSPSELQDIVFQNMQVEQAYDQVKDKVVSLAGYAYKLLRQRPWTLEQLTTIQIAAITILKRHVIMMLTTGM